MSNDFIPKADDPFNSFFTALNTYAQDTPDLLGLSSAQAATLLARFNAWTDAWAAWEAIQNLYDAKLAAKNEARATATVLIRQINAIAQADPAVLDTSRQQAGLPVHKTTRTAAPVPGTHPVLYKVDNEHLLQRVWFSDQHTVGKKGKPARVDGCEFRREIVAAGAPAPTDPDAMPYLATGTKNPHRTDLEPEDVGKVAYYCQRWVNPTGEVGPWGLITSYPVV